ncbi:helix-turn-helix transcriptional regulator [Streptomyces sp. 4N124]|uniref:helix-turn-helix transcriptional regulator n=1 Tax=Streptomyces sp. 4N124 TaxID=3457420 RepID=UPI003FCEFB1B
MKDHYLSVGELAERYGIPQATIYGWNSDRTGPPYIKIGKHVRYRPADLAAWEDGRLNNTEKVNSA